MSQTRGLDTRLNIKACVSLMIPTSQEQAQKILLKRRQPQNLKKKTKTLMIHCEVKGEKC